MDQQEIIEQKFISNPDKILEPVVIKDQNGNEEIVELSSIRKDELALSLVAGADKVYQVDQELKMMIRRTLGISLSEFSIIRTRFDYQFNIFDLIQGSIIINNLNDLSQLRKTEQ